MKTEIKQMSYPDLVKSDSLLKLKVSDNLERKIRYMCNILPSTEWSGILFYTYKGGFSDNSLEITAEDFLLMDIGEFLKKKILLI